MTIFQSGDYCTLPYTEDDLYVEGVWRITEDGLEERYIQKLDENLQPVSIEFFCVNVEPFDDETD